jgi:Ca2+-binding RTX toxin-like protein
MMRTRIARAAHLLTVAAASVAGLVVVTGHADAAVSGAVSNGTLTITGDAADNSIFMRLKAGAPNTLELDLGGDGTAEQSFDRNTFTTIVVNAGGGNDLIRLDVLNGVFTAQEATTVKGQDGNDTLQGTPRDETFEGGAGDDTLDTNGGNDNFLGGAGNDQVIMGFFGSHVVDGGSGNDTATADGVSFAGDNITIDGVTAPGHILFRNPAQLADHDLVAVEKLEVDGEAGDDTINTIGVGGSLALDIDGGDGNDTITGGDGADQITGGRGNDTLAGGKGNDVFFHASTDDNDHVDGQEGSDTEVADGTSAADSFTLFDNAGRTQLDHSLGGTINMATVERLALNTLAGDDAVRGSRDLPGVTAVDIATDPTTGSDGEFDSVVIDGTASVDTFTVKKGTIARHFRVSSGAGRPVYDIVAASETRIAAGDSDDKLTSSLPSTPFFTVLTMSGDAGNDTITGGANDDGLIGGNGNDTLRGGAGIDLLLGEAGDDRLFGDAGNDGLHGGPGIDRLDGGAGSDQYTCGGPGDTIISDTTETIGADCT